jgi:hypothetical protein
MFLIVYVIVEGAYFVANIEKFLMVVMLLL